MKRRIITNILLAYILLPVIISVRDYIKIDILHDEKVFHGSFISYVSAQLSMLFLHIPTIFLVFILLPYNAILIRAKKDFTLLQKIVIFELVCIVVFSSAGTFTNVWRYPYWENVYTIFYFLPVSILFAGLIHLIADGKVQRDS